MEINARAIRISVTLIAVAGLTAAMGNACSQLQGGSSTAASNSIGGATCTAAPVAVFQPAPGAITPGIVYGSNVVQNMAVCTGLGMSGLSDATNADIAARSSSFSQTSFIGNINSAMMMAIAAVSFDVCSDLANKEAALPAASRTVFNTFDFTSAGPMPIADVDDALARMARNCWGRLPTAAETTAVEQAMSSLTMTTPQYTAIGVCSGVLASLSGILQ